MSEEMTSEREAAKREYRKARFEMTVRHEEEKRALAARQQEEAGALWRRYCEQAVPA